MPPRRATQRAVAGEGDELTSEQTQRNRRENTSDGEEQDDETEMSQDNRASVVVRLSKQLVRYALSCEYARKPIKRTDINEKVLGSRGRYFREVFLSADTQLQQVFGVQMIELPKPEKVTLRQKRAATSESQSKSSNMWILQTILPEQYRIPDIIGPSQPLEKDIINQQDAYVGLYTMIIALIVISGGKIAEGTLNRQLRRMNADHSTPIGSKEKALANMVKDGYIVKVRESLGDGDEDHVEYVVGPRGKVEVGREGVAKLVRMMYGQSEDSDELERRIQRMFDVTDVNATGKPSDETAVTASSQMAGRKRGRPKREADEGD